MGGANHRGARAGLVVAADGRRPLVGVVGSAFNTAYRNDIAGRLDGLPTDVADGAQEAPAIALEAAGGLGADGAQLVASAQHAFESGLRAAVLLSAALFAFGALYTWWRGEDAVPAEASDDDLAGAAGPSGVEVVPEAA